MRAYGCMRPSVCSTLQVMRSAEWVVIDSEISQPRFYRVVFSIDERPFPEREDQLRSRAEKRIRDRAYGGFEIRRRRTVAMDASRWCRRVKGDRSEEHTSELQSLMRISYAVFCLK